MCDVGIILDFTRQDDLESLSSKSSTLQSSANQFTQLASRIRVDQDLQRYKLYCAVGLSALLIILIASFWGQPSKLFMALLILATISGGVFFYFHQRQEASNRLSDRYSSASPRPDQEMNPIKGSIE